jgi:hypothetical protein
MYYILPFPIKDQYTKKEEGPEKFAGSLIAFKLNV